MVLFGMTALFFGQNIGWSVVNSKIRSEFPDVPRISTSQLAVRLSNPKQDGPVLFDVRTAVEFEVSHLEGAQRIEPDTDPKTISVPKDKAIVTYCSVGYRSAAFAKKLRDAGYSRVANLEGSIFRWANENRPLVHDGKPTDKVHPYNRIWGVLVEESRRVAHPSLATPQTRQ